MTDNELRVKIAEACGYTPEPNRPGFWLKEGTIIAYSLRADGFPLPDYLNDLNAMHEAEKYIPRHLWSEYTMELRKVIQRECDTPEHYILGCERSQRIADFWFYHATARQRALAFVQTIAAPPPSAGRRAGREVTL